MWNRIKWIAVLSCCLLTIACVPAKGVRELFEQSVKDYNRMLRWKEIPGAGFKYMTPELREEHLAAAKLLSKRDVTITDYRILFTECFPEQMRGDALVEFDYYILPSNRIKTLTYKQDWVYKELELNQKRIWKLTSAMPLFP